MTHSKQPIDLLLRTFEDVLDASDFPGEVKGKAPSGLKRCIEEFRNRPENRGRKRLKREPADLIRKTLKHVTHAVDHAGAHEDSNVKTQARALVRSLQYGTFDAIEERARRFNGLLRKVGHRRNERRRKKDRRRYQIRDDLTLQELNSVGQLRSTGKELALCVARFDELGRDYHDRLRSKASEFWRIEGKKTGKGLIEIDSETRRVVEMAGGNNRDRPESRDSSLQFRSSVGRISRRRNPTFNPPFGP